MLWIIAVQANAEEVAFHRLKTGHLVVQTSLNGATPAPYVLDTGASVTVVDTRAWALSHEDEGHLTEARAAGGTVKGRVVGRCTWRWAEYRPSSPVSWCCPSITCATRTSSRLASSGWTS